jgi:hypothetical protein
MVQTVFSRLATPGVGRYLAPGPLTLERRWRGRHLGVGRRGGAAPVRRAVAVQLGAPYNPRGHNLGAPVHHGTGQRARSMTTGTVDQVREDY